VEHRDLKSLYEGIDIDEQEAARSRQRLLQSLKQTDNPTPVRQWLQIPWALRVSVVCLLLITLGLTGWRQYRQASFETLEIVSLETLMQRYGDHQQLYRQAKEMEASAEPLRKLNGLYILSTLGQNEENILASAQGLLEDPRAEFRAYYLDYLITHADTAYYDLEYLEALIERETDPECLELLYELLALAEHTQRSLNRA